ncbi:hypothetical protein EJP77_11690 [Paenibacillus zeisoli]|uniref:Uncharacterized protein n=1 Tax=Paenibacillus zeisoli TaxID=2496267 RepID=A0A433X8Y4_9BACL|nr:hypothetical protein [Paenibacillus zeisoli]RUT30494.1 hypothetical protein EJP77_11690 [Paenibacillus zeisoli]
MGQRANLIIVRNESYELYYSHWCANTLPQDLFWGEQYAIQFIEMQTRVDESGWLDDVWAEGGAILDLDKKKLIFYGGEDLLYDIPLRKLYLKLMRTTWQDWEIEWAYEGILDLATYVGYPKEKVLTSSEIDINYLSLAPPEEKSWVDTVASVKFSQNELLLFPISGGVDIYLSYGPDLINNIDKSFGYKSISLKEWSKDFPMGGFHIDITSNRLEYWHANDIPNISQELRSKWPDWDVIENYDNYESQYNSTNGLLEFQDISQHQLLRELKVLLLSEPSNPINAIECFIKKEADAGKKVEVNPHALKNDRYELPKNVKEEILEFAIDNL